MMIVYSDNVVECTGEPLHPVIWQGRQWAVTTYGVECRDGGYHIEKRELLKNDSYADGYTWEKHMNEKAWVDAADFATAMLVARGFFGYPDLRQVASRWA